MRLRFILAVFMLVAAIPALAETFTVYNLGGDDVSLLGIDAGGTVLIQQLNTCSGTGGPTNCYEEFANGVLTYRADALPSDFVSDNGSPCSSSAVGSLAEGRSVCDDGFHVFGEFPFQVRESSPETGPMGDIAYGGTDDGPLVVNGSGDFATLNGDADELVAVDVSETPEPSSLLLLGTGLLGFAGPIRRRLY